MIIHYWDEDFEIPDILIDKFTRDFDGLPGSGQYESVLMLRESVYNVLDVIEDDPELLEEPEYMDDFVRALAVKKALENNGIMYDS